MHRLLRWAAWALASVLVLVGAGASCEALAATQDMVRYPPPGRLVDVGGHTLHLNCRGVGSPTVVLEAGSGGDVLSWGKALPEGIAGMTRVCAYDRAGLGWSEAGPEPRTGARVADELHALLANAGERGPYVLVGFSLGGKFTRLFAARYPEEVAGLVFVDAAHEDVDDRLGSDRKQADIQQTRQFRDSMVLLRRFGIIRVLLPWASSLAPADIRSLPTEYFLMFSRQEAAASNWMEDSAYAETNAQLRAAQWTHTAIPLVVLAGTGPFADPIGQQAWAESQPGLAQLSSNSRLVWVEGTGHAIHMDRPELVATAIRDVVEAARG